MKGLANRSLEEGVPCWRGAALLKVRQSQGSGNISVCRMTDARPDSRFDHVCFAGARKGIWATADHDIAAGPAVVDRFGPGQSRPSLDSTPEVV